MRWAAAGQGTGCVEQPVRGRAGQLAGAGVAGDLGQRGQPVGGRGHRDHRCDALVPCGGRDDVTAGVGGPPEHDPVGVDAGQGSGGGDRRVVVLTLAPVGHELAGGAVGGAEAAVVEHERVDAGLSERLGVGQQPGGTMVAWPCASMCSSSRQKCSQMMSTLSVQEMLV